MLALEVRLFSIHSNSEALGPSFILLHTYIVPYVFSNCYMGPRTPRRTDATEMDQKKKVFRNPHLDSLMFAASDASK